MGDQGIKLFKANLKCSLSIKGQVITQGFSGELKIQKSDEWIGVVTLKSVNGGPQVLIAVNRLKKGLHNKEHNKKTFSSKDLQVLDRPKVSGVRTTLFADPATALNRGVSPVATTVSSTIRVR